MKWILSSIKMISGFFLIILLIVIWIINIIFGFIVSIVTWLEVKLGDLMRKMLEEEDLT